jgi:hypothetical protein
MDDLSPEAILGIAAGVVGGVFGIGVLAMRFACPRMFAAQCGLRQSKSKRFGLRVVPKSDTLEISQNPILILAEKRHAHALPYEVDLDSVLAVRRLKREFKVSPVGNGGSHAHCDAARVAPVDGGRVYEVASRA